MRQDKRRGILFDGFPKQFRNSDVNRVDRADIHQDIMGDALFLVQEEHIEMLLFKLFKGEIHLRHEILGGIRRGMQCVRFFEDPDMLSKFERLGAEIKRQLIGVVAFAFSHIYDCSKKCSGVNPSSFKSNGTVFSFHPLGHVIAVALLSAIGDPAFGVDVYTENISIAARFTQAFSAKTKGKRSVLSIL